MSRPLAPVKTKIDLKDYVGISEPWRKWFNGFYTEVEDKLSPVPSAVPGNLVVWTSTGRLADAGLNPKKFPSVTYYTTTYLTAADFGKVVKFDNGANAVVCYLPSVGASDVDSWLNVMRLGTGMLTIKAADADTIEKSRTGGEIRCNEAGRVIANLMFFLATETKWAILGGTGIWVTY